MLFPGNNTLTRELLKTLHKQIFTNPSRESSAVVGLTTLNLASANFSPSSTTPQQLESAQHQSEFLCVPDHDYPAKRRRIQ